MKFRFPSIVLALLFSFFVSQNYENYTVQNGDSYYLIGKKFSINYLDIIKLNEGKRLVAGEVIKVPFYFFHTVKTDENLTFLSKKYLVSIDDIAKLNGLKNKYLYVGQRLKIPKYESNFKVSAYLKNDGLYNPNNPNQIEVPSDEQMADNLPSPHAQELSFTWPVNGRVYNQNEAVSTFKENLSLGIPIRTLNNDTVHASEDGIVVFQGEIRGFGKSLFITHDGEVITAYMGIKEFFLYENQVVQKGQPIAKTTRSLFFSIFLRGDPQNPTEYFNKSSI